VTYRPAIRLHYRLGIADPEKVCYICVAVEATRGRSWTAPASGSCVSCRTLAGELVPPGGIVYDHAHWVVFLRSRPLLTPGQGLIALKRHCEDVAALTTEEAATLGEAMRRTAKAYTQVLAGT
jgi:hypothetical protein